jgi:hypothetical protein
MLDGASFLSICADAWTSTGRHITAVTGGGPGQSVYLNSYENHSYDTAETTASAIHDCVLVSLGLKTNNEPTDKCYPTRKVAIFTSDTTALMPATACELSKKPMFQCLVWLPCCSHVANLCLLDMHKVPASFLASAKQISTTFRAGNVRKQFIQYAPSAALALARLDRAPSDCRVRMQHSRCRMRILHFNQVPGGDLTKSNATLMYAGTQTAPRHSCRPSARHASRLLRY